MVERLVDGHMEAKVKIKRKVKDLVLTIIKREITHIILKIKKIEIKEEEEDLGEDLEEEASMDRFLNVEKDIEPMSVLNIKEGKIKELRVTLELPMWMKMSSHHF